MKFCYIDESGTGSEPYAVMVGIIVDAQRMKPTKADWNGLLEKLSKIIGKDVPEFHTRDFYPGNGIWRGISGNDRKLIISEILKWLVARKHQLAISSIDKEKYKAERAKNSNLVDIKSLWQMLALHIVLSIQKAHSKIAKNKGNTVLVFDREVTEEQSFTELLLSPPSWSETYYGRGKKEEPLDQIIDVPHFADSTHVPLLQVADVAAYFVRRFLELENDDKERYEGEKATVSEWATTIFSQAMHLKYRYPRRDRCNCAQTFFDCAPQIILTK